MPPTFLFYALLTLCGLLVLGLSWVALRRPNRQRLVLRLLAGAVAGAGLWLTAYPPARTVPGPRAEAILLTDGFQPDTLSTLLRRLGPATRLWRTSSTTGADTVMVSNLLQLREQQPSLRRLHVLGRGLPAADLPMLGPVRLVWHAPSARVGFRTANWTPRPELGQPLLIAGFFDNLLPDAAKSAPVWVHLRAGGAPRDSVRLPAGRGAFQLTYVPKAAGLAVYELIARRGGQILATEPVPVEVVPTRALRVLLLAGTPSFEFKFLKNQLGTRQHAVALRVGISRGLTQTEFLNQPAHDISRLTPALLTRYDAVVADASTLAGGEAQQLTAALRAGGPGLILLADAGPLPRLTPGRAAFSIVPVATAASARPQPVRWQGGPGRATTTVPATVRASARLRPLITTGQGQAVVAAQRVGAGTMVVSVLPETFRWALQNDSLTYNAYWSRLLTAVARPEPATATWRVITAWPRSNVPVEVQLTAAAFPAAAPTVRGAAGRPVTLSMRQDTRLPEWSTGQFWPDSAGWYRVALPDKASHWFYVFGGQNWLGPENELRRQAAQAWLATSSSPRAASPELTRQSWPAAWFFGLFLLGAGFLWLEEKL
ncbi:hypothetical protein SAMN00120144_2321 [Hymenobacter roseosalivarius DSM 11622]|uniref:Uncharacterized protein n=1 Tax=Hymenobacter roseosalivarius DSM 11622 TaxID=645990 RepID=A0A1W1VKS7_9BACT|nr:hypothetical protein [Hymenobacter roseosalivarius]SMB93989.1 hypothetical protein SAMN00120144_2321 [Hymenobacter roseosalivarius DSM 11622]